MLRYAHAYAAAMHAGRGTHAPIASSSNRFRCAISGAAASCALSSASLLALSAMTCSEHGTAG